MMTPRIAAALFANYDKQVRAHALRALTSHGYYGLDPREDAPSTYDEIRSAVERGHWKGQKFEGNLKVDKNFPVYNLHCENTVFLNPVGNLLFRAWHDLEHYSLGADLSYEGEHRVSVMQSLRFAGEYREICLADTIGQLNFHHFTGGLFVENQRQFVYDWMTIGEQAAIVKHERAQRNAVVH